MGKPTFVKRKGRGVRGREDERARPSQYPGLSARDWASATVANKIAPVASASAHCEWELANQAPNYLSRHGERCILGGAGK